MKFIPNTLLILALILVAAACSSEATSNGSGHDGSAIGGETDGGGKTDTASADSNDAGPDNGSTDVATTEEVDVAKPFCPQPGDPAEATLEIQLADGPQCFVPGTEQTTMILAFVNAKIGIGNNPLANMMPAAPDDGVGGGGCATIGMPDYCFPLAKVFGKGYKPKWADLLGENAGKPFLVVKYPDSSTYPKGGTELVIVGCASGICTLSSIYSDGSYDNANYDINQKTLTISWYPETVFAYTDVYKLE